ncbi:SDR family NAD(P)-dependent oxidoreductase, partial [Streptomyces sp. NPDC059740]|uniref:SDR family NAD(P)-dependent oxidoreductase n=1 Tax=Streptomyces sp. NPDC059740 TaxID=3346926 RepID=UPI003657EF1F
VAGGSVDWRSVLSGRSVELPTYPFQHTRYWPEARARNTERRAASETESGFWSAVEDGDLSGLTESLAIDGDRPFHEALPALADWRRREREDSAVADWRYRVTWEQVPDPAPAPLTGTWLLLSAPDRTPEPVHDALTTHGARVLRLVTRSADRAELAALLTTELSGVDDLAGLVVLPAPGETSLPGQPAVPQGVAQVLSLVQALGDAGVQAPVWALTCGAVEAGPAGPPADPAQAQTWGLGRVVALEHPERWGGVVDLPATLDARAATRLAAVLSGTTGEDQVALRRTGLLARRVERAPLPPTGHTWHPRGSVLVTGGTGGIATGVDRWLAQRGTPRLTLTSRSGPAAQGTAVLAAELAERGTTTEVFACDVAERDQVAAVIDRMPDLCAVIHTAGIGQFSATDAVTPEAHANVVTAKTAGARWLDELTAGRDLDAFVVFSSISATWGSSMQPSYAAANAYLDALVEDRRSRGLPGTSLGWGVWGGAGMGAGDVGTQLGRAGLRRMDPALGVRALAQAVDAGEGVVAVADVDWSAFAPTFTVRRPSPLLTSLPDARSALTDETPTDPQIGGGLARRLAEMTPAEQERTVVDLVRTEAATALGYSSTAEVEPDRSFKELGFESLTAVELRNRLQTVTGLALPATLAFDHPNAADLAAYLRGELVGDGGEPAGITEELDRFEGLLTTAEADEETRELVAARLQRLAARLRTDAGTTDTDTGRAVAERIETASDDEMFEFINKQLGRSE